MPNGQRGNYKTIALLIPAHNEEASIADTIQGALRQTILHTKVKLHIYVIADNCTDKTVHIVQEMIQRLESEASSVALYLLKTHDNRYRKAGALNQAYEYIREFGYKYIATADADTVWDEHFLERGFTLLRKNRKGEIIGGVCGRVGLLPFKLERFRGVPLTGHFIFFKKAFWPLLFACSGASWLCRQVWRYAWWCSQNVEYSLAQSEIIERMGVAHCLCGPGTIFRAEVLEQFYQAASRVWPQTMVEDFDITVRIQMLGYKTIVGHDMFVYTDCPIGFRAHRIQRERWNGGNLSTFMHIGINRETFRGGMEMGWQLIWFVCRINVIITAIQVWQNGFVYIDQPGLFFLIVPLALTAALNLLRFKYVAYKSPLQFLLLVGFGYELYALWYGFILIKSYLKAFTNSVNRWR